MGTVTVNDQVVFRTPKTFGQLIICDGTAKINGRTIDLGDKKRVKISFSDLEIVKIPRGLRHFISDLSGVTFTDENEIHVMGPVTGYVLMDQKF